MALIYGFPPLANPESRLLILGSMPGKASLQAGRYYAHERNAFWRIMGDLLGADLALDYPQRVGKLQAAGVALWDVMAACERAGSLDSDIVGKSVQPNDFATFFAVNRNIGHIFFNGAAAEASFRRHVLPTLQGPPLRLMRLPSTSPAHAAQGYAEKLAAWSAIIALPDK
ncbi:MAG: DNA-deoxyinosine glycosylase [Azonexus sp.]|nr:DNA-deoxyinosine glycosylase [Azonexus sp.]MDZ4316495.1 DNA-deoxyinosine glycosylase [Azonexus sp.]